MTDSKWRDGVKVVRGASLSDAMSGPAGSGRATAFSFAGTGGKETWIGTVTMPPNAVTGAHQHGRHEVAIFVVRGCSEIRWGEALQFVAEVDPGDFVYFTPNVPHQERNLSSTEPVEFVVVRSDNATIADKLGVVPVDRPEVVF
jgi:uncharacterized RmlC-like cupin family protein